MHQTHHPGLAITVTMLTFLCSAHAAMSAQPVSQVELESCAGKKTPELKLACFEALTARGRPEDEATPVAAPEDDRTVEAPVAKTAGAPTAAAAAVITAPSPAPESEPVTMSPQPAAAQAGKAGDATPGPADDLGSEQLRRHGDEDKDQEKVTAVVTEVRKGRRNVLYFHLANGQVWRQIEARRFRYPRDGDFEVTISKGMMGEYRLRVGEDSPMTRIRRVE